MRSLVDRRREPGSCAACGVVPVDRCATPRRVRDVAANGHDELFLIDGNSLAYRAFFALPESIATSTGFPTNTIFGFASMLVKLLTEYGPKPTIVVWDAGSLGAQGGLGGLQGHAPVAARPAQGAVAAPRAAGRRLRLPQHRGRRLRGRRRHRLASPSARATPGVPVMVVTGDRDAFQLIDPESRVKVMATGARDHRHQDLRPPGGHRPLRHRARAGPRLLRPQGRHLGQHPRRPGHRRQDGLRAAAALRLARGGPRPHRRHLRRQAQGEPDRARRRRARCPSSSRRSSATCRSRSTRWPRPRASPTARACARSSASSSCASRCARLEEAFGEGDDGAAPAPVARGHGPGARARGLAGRRRRLRARQGGHRRGRRARDPEGQLVADRHPLALRRGRRRERARRRVRRPRGARRRARRPARRRPRRQGARRRAARPRPTTPAGRLPARARAPGLPVPRDLRGARPGLRRRRPGRRRRRRPAGARRLAARAARRARARVAAWPRSSCRSCAVLRDMEVAGVRLNRERLAEVDKRVRDEIHGLEREIWTLAGEEFVIGSPQQLGAVLFEKLGLSRKRRGKTGFSTDARVLQAIRDEHEIIPKIERWRELNQILKTYLDVLPQLDRHRVARAHDLRAGGRHHRPAGLDEPQHAERPGAHRARAARSAAASRPRPATCSSRPTTRRSSCACWPTSPASRCSRRSSSAARTSTPRPARWSSARTPSELTPMDRSKSKMINYGIVYGLSDYGLADRLNIPREEAKAFIDAYLERFPQGRRVHPHDDRVGPRAGPRDDALRPAPADPRAARAQLAGALARRAPGGQHGHPGHRGRHHEAGDDPRAPRAGRERP